MRNTKTIITIEFGSIQIRVLDKDTMKSESEVINTMSEVNQDPTWLMKRCKFRIYLAIKKLLAITKNRKS